MRKKLLFLTMLMALLISCSEDEFNDNTNEENQSETLDQDLFVISNVEELYAFADSVALDSSFGGQLSANIDMSEQENWTPIELFSGVFKGNEKSILSLKIEAEASYIGFFGTLDGASIQDLTIDCVITNNGAYTGALAGFASNYTTIKNCNTTATSSVYGANYYVGGLVGLTNNSTITDCINKASVEGEQRHVGGIVGGNRVSSTVDNCSNSGAITSDDTEGRYIGGITGSNNESVVTNSNNTGTITGGCYYVGGITGVSEESTGLISNSYNEAKIVSTAAHYVGGVIGANMTAAVVKNTYNSGEVQGGSHIGGVVGRNDSSLVEDSYNTGDVSDAGDSGNVGGVVGYNRTDAVISNCYNTGSVTSLKYAGGVAAWNLESLVINSYNTGDIKSEESYAGGVLGGNSTSAIAVNCYSIASVYAPTISGGVSGLAASTSQFYTCYSVGVISADDSMQGGVIGKDNGASFTSCYYDNTVYTTASDTSYGLSTTYMNSEEFYQALDSWAQYYNTLNSTASYLACPWVNGSSYPTLDMDGEAL